MRIVMLAAVFATGSAALAAQAPSPPDPQAILSASRTALGGDARLSAIKTLTATGRTRQIRGDNLVPIEFEIGMELPAKYSRKDEVPAQESGPTAVGFKGDGLIQDPLPPIPPQRAGGPAPPTP